MEKFHQVLQKAKHIVVLTGAGVSAESGVPTFRGSQGLWRNFSPQELATPEAFHANPSLVWEFYHYRREIIAKCQPNQAHQALVTLEKQLERKQKKFTLITQNVDRLHQLAGSKNVLEIHGSLWLVKRIHTRGFVEEPNKVWEDRVQPIVPALKGKGLNDITQKTTTIPRDQLPHAPNDGALLRPAVVWFGESLDHRVIEKVEQELKQCDLFIVAGTSSVVYPAAGYAQFVASRGVPVAEFNLEKTPNTSICAFKFQGKCSDTMPKAFQVI
jgi:NAD-dependent deacetylase sirtuin 5